jgi:hypothetical protein
MDNLVRGSAHRREVDWTRGVGAASRRLTRAAVEGLRTTGCLQGVSTHAVGEVTGNAWEHRGGDRDSAWTDGIALATHQGETPCGAPLHDWVVIQRGSCATPVALHVPGEQSAWPSKGVAASLERLRPPPARLRTKVLERRSSLVACQRSPWPKLQPFSEPELVCSSRCPMRCRAALTTSREANH